MKWKIEFEIDLPTDSWDHAFEWAKFVTGYTASMSGKNPCTRIDLPADHERVSRPYVTEAR